MSHIDLEFANKANIAAARRFKAERDKWRSLAVGLAKQHKPHAPALELILDEIYALDKAANDFADSLRDFREFHPHGKQV